MPVSYITRQQQAVLQALASCPGGRATATELAERLHAGGQRIGLSTVYRQLDKLTGQGKVHKLLTDGAAFFQYCNKAAHQDCFLLKCEGCGAVFHADCSRLGELYGHLLVGHGFAINPRRTMFYGLCEKCREAQP